MTASRSLSYPAVGYRVRMPEDIWQAALDELRVYANLLGPGGESGCEGLVYLAGVPANGEIVVTGLFLLRHEAQGDRVAPTREEVRWLIGRLRDRDEKLIAQIHTHRHSANHSPGDDFMATSFHDGFLSIVVPGFALGVDRLEQCGVHEYSDGTFQRLEEGEVVRRFRLYDLTTTRKAKEESWEAPWWRRFAQNLRSIALKRL